MTTDTKRSFTCTASRHHAKRISVHLTRSLSAGHSNLSQIICGLVNTGECHYTLVPQALCSIEFLARVTFTYIETTFGYPQKQFLIPYPSGKCGYPQLVQDSSMNLSFLVSLWIRVCQNFFPHDPLPLSHETLG